MNDPIIDEIRKIRREIEAECGHDAENHFNYLQNIQKKYKNLFSITDSMFVLHN